MTRRPVDVVGPTPEQAVRALTREIPNYLDRVRDVTGGRARDLYALVLGDPESSYRTGFDSQALGAGAHEFFRRPAERAQEA